MLAELSRLYSAGGASVIAALVLGSYLLYFCGAPCDCGVLTCASTVCPTAS